MIDIPGYSIKREIGRGGTARVYLGVQKKFGRLVAVKVVSSQFTADPTFGKRFVREARIIAQLTHPNIVQVHDVGVSDDHYYLVMEYLRGGDLNRRLQRGVHMQEVLRVVKDISRALQFAHEKGYVHRDIKPENILFREEGSAVLTDFGIAKVITADKNFTRQGSVIGTPQYMSPEQASGKELDGRSDIYSLGVVFYRMLTGEVPFKAETAVAVGVRHLQDPIPTLPAHLSAFQSVINCFLAKNPEDRFQSGVEIEAALDGIRTDGLVPNSVLKTEVVTTAEIRAVTSHDIHSGNELRAIRTEPHRYRKKGRSGSRLGLLLVILLISAGAAFALYPERDLLIDKALYRLGIAEDPALHNAWAEARSLRGDPNQSLASIVAAYRRVLTLAPNDAEALAAIDGLASQWKSDIEQSLEQKDLALAETKLNEALNVFPEDREFDTLSERLANNQRAEQLLASTQALLRSHGLSDLPSATAAIQSFQEVLRLAPGNQVATEELNKLAGHYAKLAEDALTQNNVTAAMSYLERANTANADYPELDLVREQIQKAAAVQAEIALQIQQAGQYRAQGALIEPPGENAAEIYHRVLATDPSNSIASQGLSEVVAQVVSNAVDLLAQGKTDAVNQLVTRASEIGLDDSALAEMRSKLDQEVQRQKDIASHLQTAESLYQQGFITSPAENNAVSELLSVLQLDPGNEQAQEMIQKCSQRLADVAMQAYEVGLEEEAKQYLDLALAVTPDAREWRELREQWNGHQEPDGTLQ